MSFDDRLHRLSSDYIAAPQWVKSLAGGVYSMLPPTLRFGAPYARFRQRFEHAVGPDLGFELLGQTLRTALTSVPAWRDHAHLIDGLREAPLEVLRQLPLTSKEQIKTSLERYCSSGLPPSARLKMFTGGSTSVPMTFYLHRGISRAKEWAAFHAMGQHFGTEGHGVILALRGRTVSTAGQGRLWMYEPIKRHLIVSTDHLEPRFMPQYMDVLRRHRPVYIHAFPSALFPLVSWLRERGAHELLAGVRCVMLTSESVFEHHMAVFRDFFRCPVILHYGHTERVLFANTLADDARYHFWPHYGYFELLNTAGEPVTTPGQVGEIVGTSFDNLAMPFVRYRTGDYAALSEHPAPALAGWPVVDRIEGRLQEYVVCHDHRLVTVTTLGAAHFEQLHQCLRIQYEQLEPGRLILRVVPLQPLSAAAREQIARAVSDKMQGGCTLEIVEVASIPLTERGKQRLLVQHLDVGRYLGAAMAYRGDAGMPLRETQPVQTRTQPEAAPASPLAPGQSLLMIGTSPEMRGGIAAVVSTLRQGGLFESVPTVYVVSHVDGPWTRKLARFGASLLEARQQLRSGRIALVHVHSSSRGSFWRKSAHLWMARRLGVPTVFHLHSGGFADFALHGLGGPLLRWSIRRTLEASSATVVLSERWADWARTFAPRSKVELLGNPTPCPADVPAPSQRGGASGPGRVLFLGLIGEAKGCFDLLRAWTTFRAQCPGWRLAVGGNGEVERFLAEAERLGIRADIDYLGWVAGAEKERELRRADIFVLPSYAEGMPVSLLEAMAYGAAVITTPVGGIADMMVPDRQGLWVQPGDVAGLADKLVALASSLPLRERLAAAAREHVIAHNSTEAVIERLCGVYSRVLGSRSTAAR